VETVDGAIQLVAMSLIVTSPIFFILSAYYFYNKLTKISGEILAAVYANDFVSIVQPSLISEFYYPKLQFNKFIQL
jgi:hypothetical protein